MSSLGAIPNDGSHPCENKNCSAIVPYDDEPWCFNHSQNSGSHVPGYSYRKQHAKTTTE